MNRWEKGAILKVNRYRRRRSLTYWKRPCRAQRQNIKARGGPLAENLSAGGDTSSGRRLGRCSFARLYKLHAFEKSHRALFWRPLARGARVITSGQLQPAVAPSDEHT